MPKLARRKNLIFLGLLFIAVLCFDPFPTQVFPSLTVQLSDDQGKPLSGSFVHWRGGFYAGEFEKYGRLDNQGQIIVPAEQVWISVASRLLSAMNAIRPHERGLGLNYADITIDLREGYDLDMSRMHDQIVRQSAYDAWILINGWQIDVQDYDTGTQILHNITLNPDDPQRKSSASLHIVLRRRSATSRSAAE
jgi:hypothetical protein